MMDADADPPLLWQLLRLRLRTAQPVRWRVPSFTETRVYEHEEDCPSDTNSKKTAHNQCHKRKKALYNQPSVQSNY